MRRSTQLICFTIILSSFLAAPAAAQTAVSGGVAVGGDIGVFFPDEAFEKTFTLDGFGEYYVTPRISIRGMLGYASPGFENLTEDHFRQVRLLFNGVYYWSHDKWRPYVTAGAGAYFVRALLTGPDPDSESRGGINFGGGTEYSIGSMATLKGELRWDIVSEPPGLPDATGVSLTLGFKRYF
ncbi:MAG TPA: outer membrane beta-barrel protein [Vicinamibacterales bacterium]|nr:outer membrane beta-barrel protein [Vicinamibacterales bacterium]